ncbi:TonB-dependent receptor [Microbulbifer sp. S227A]|uniref:TonB-dependent receptor n=1 Tax=Microbulbifer sp. S227A TaxID=3415131 RepID=UPI003C7A561F
MPINKLFTKTALAVGLASAATTAWAELEEVTVTATKREQSVQDIAVSVSALSAEEMQQAGIDDAKDVAVQVPSLTVNRNLSPFAAGIRIRGLGTNQNDPSLEASVAVVVDGVYLGRSGLGLSDLVDIERVEVVQGPQGTLYGKNANAGVLNIVTRGVNMQESEARLEASAGDYGLQKYTASVSAPIGDTAGYRLSGSVHERDGWLESGTGPDQNDRSDWNLRGKFAWEPTDALSVNLIASHVERDSSCCGADTTISPAMASVLQMKGLEVPENDPLDYYSNNDYPLAFTLSADALSAVVDYDLSFGTLTSITAWNDYEWASSFDGDRTELDLYYVDDSYRGESLVQELRLSSDLDGPLQYLAGLYFSHEELGRGDGQPIATFGSDILTVGTQVHPLGQAFAMLVRPGDSATAENTWETDTFAAFGQATYTFSDSWEASVGLRYTAEEKSADMYVRADSTATGIPAGAFGPGVPAMPIPTLVSALYAPVDDSFSLEDESVTGMASLTHFVNEDVMVFASIATGHKSGGFNGVAGAGAERTYDNEQTTNYELGIKSRLFDNQLELNATAFHMLVDDLQYLRQQAIGLGTYVANEEDEGTIKGVDLNFAAAPWQFLKLSGGVQYLDNDVFPASRWTSNLAATLMAPVADGAAYLRTDYNYASDHLVNPDVPDFVQDRETVNVRAGWRNESWDAALWAKNATNDVYSYLRTVPAAMTGAQQDWLAEPRTIGATVSYQF